MNFKTIETTRLKLDGLYPEDMTYIFENNSKSKIIEILGLRNEEDYLKEERKQKSGLAGYNRSFILFLIKDKETHKIIGKAGFHNWNVEHNRAELGYEMIDDSYKMKGLMHEAVVAIIDYGFSILQLNRIEAFVGSENIPSLRIMEKNNFKKEGLLRKHYYFNHVYEDSVVFSILAIEYPNNKKDL